MSLEISEYDRQKSRGWELLSAFPHGHALNYMHPCTLQSTQILNSTATATGGEALSPSFWKAGFKLVDPLPSPPEPVWNLLDLFVSLSIIFFLPHVHWYIIVLWMLGLLAGTDMAFHPKILQCSFLNILLGIYVWCFLAWDLTSTNCGIQCMIRVFFHI